MIEDQFNIQRQDALLEMSVGVEGQSVMGLVRGSRVSCHCAIGPFHMNCFDLRIAETKGYLSGGLRKIAVAGVDFGGLRRAIYKVEGDSAADCRTIANRPR